MKIHYAAGARALGLLLVAALAACATPSARTHELCAPIAEWTIPGSSPVPTPALFARAADAQVVLLGESHDNPDHHRWELQTVAALAALHPRLVLGFEMFPRRVQSALDRWVAGELSEAEFLRAADWSEVWGYEAGYYLPLFQFARLNRIPMLALNVERSLVRRVSKDGLATVPQSVREGVGEPAPAGENYRARLFHVYAQHADKNDAKPARTDARFGHFVEAQLVWDRAMAQALADAAARSPDALVVGIMGSQHVAHGDGVAHQLASLGIKRVMSLLPWSAETDCGDFSAGLADAVYGLPETRALPKVPPPRLLGIRIEAVAEGIRVVAVSPDSVAAACGLQADDVLVEAAGAAVRTTAELRAIVTRTAPGTWLPLRALRKGETIELTARFPPEK